jgi:hypothetical protein
MAIDEQEDVTSFSDGGGGAYGAKGGYKGPSAGYYTPQQQLADIRSRKAQAKALQAAVKPQADSKPDYGGFSSGFERDLAVRERDMAQKDALSNQFTTPARKAAYLRAAALQFKAAAAGKLQDPATKRALALARAGAERNVDDASRKLFASAASGNLGETLGLDTEAGSGGGGGSTVPTPAVASQAPKTYDDSLRGYARQSVFNKSFWEQPAVQDELTGGGEV